MFRILLYPFSVLYGFVTNIRNFLFDNGILESVSFNIPIISIGNITVGGTGKTPHVEYLVKILKKKGNLAVLSRGYKRKTKGFVIANNNSSSKDIGDEPKQIKKKFSEIIVSVDADRVHGVKKLIEKGINKIILDDAYQHRHIKPGLSILLIDYNRNINNDFLLPYGRLRESIKEKDRADIIIFSKTPANIKPIDRRIIVKNITPKPYQEVYFTGLKYGKIIPVLSDSITIPNDWKENTNIYSIVLVTGIANTNQLTKYLEKFSNDIHHIKYNDHVSFNDKKIKKIISTFEKINNTKKIIITTEKDAVKIEEFKNLNSTLKNNLFYLPIEIFFIEDENEFENQIIKYVEKNTRNS